MTYSIDIKNRSGAFIFGQKHYVLKPVMSGRAKPMFYNSITGSYENHNANFIPDGYTKDEILVFGRVVFDSSLTDEEAENERVKGFWPVGIEYSRINDTEYFRLTAPDNSVDYYPDRRGAGYSKVLDGTREYVNSADHWLNTEASIEYIMYTKVEGDESGLGSDDSDFGIQIFDENENKIFDSNFNFFKVEQSAYAKQNVSFFYQPYVSTSPSLNYINLVPQRLYFQNKSNSSQGHYWALLNGTAHTVAIAKGGDVGSLTSLNAEGFEIPEDITAFYNSFVEFHYYDQENIFGFRPGIIQVPRLSYTRDTSSNTIYDGEVRTANVGVPVLSMIGQSK